jgi:[protein-PII] uridylyltransferase
MDFGAERRALLADSALSASALRSALGELARTTLTHIAATALPPTYSLVTLAGTAKDELCPGSDLDVALLHPDKADESTVAKTAEALWYPLWDAGWKVTPLVHTVKSALALASRDLITATTLLDVAHLAGDTSLSSALSDDAASQWARHGSKWLDALALSVAERHQRNGEVAFLLEPDLKEGEGGLRDIHAIQWALATGSVDESTLEVPPSTLGDHLLLLLDVRTALHRSTGRPQDRLLLQEQAAVATQFAISDDELMRRVSAAGREVQWAAERFWEHQLTGSEKRRRGSKRGRGKRKLGPGIDLLGDRVMFRTDGADATVVDMLRVAAIAAQSDATIDGPTLERFARDVVPFGPDEVWPVAARQALVSVLGAGRSALRVIEALDRYRLFQRVLPEWEAVRCKPQRNAYHRFTVDRHLCEAAMNAAVLVRTVHRPDLLLLGALLHDIGKGFPGDHTIVGMELVARIGKRMGLPDDETAVLVSLVEHHLLLPEVATRRDLTDPATIELVARAVGTVETLELLSALTEADSLATGPTAWSDWKKRLLHQLVGAVRAYLSGSTQPPSLEEFPGPAHLDLLSEVRHHQHLRLVHERGRCIVAAPDRTGLLASVAGALALHGVEVLSANGWSSDDGLAIEEYRIERRLGGEPPWKRIDADLRLILAGELDLGTKLRERAAAYAGATKRTSAAPTAPPAVLVDQSASQTATLVEVRAPDRVGVLHEVADAIASAGCDIRVALVETLGHEVVDVFYIRDSNGAPVTDPDTLAQLEAEILRRLGGTVEP